VRAPTGRVGLQLFTVMQQLEQDFEGTLKAIAQIGYKEVETIGVFGRDAAYVRELLDIYGLTSPSQHLVPGDLYNAFRRYVVGRQDSREALAKHWANVMSVEQVEPVIAEGITRAKLLGQSYLVWQIIWPQQMATRGLVAKFCKALDIGAQLCAAHGVTLCFHNNDREFALIDGIVPYDAIIENTDPNLLKLEADLYWMTKAGVDPLAYLKRNPGRYKQCHLKDSTAGGDMTTVGRGTVNFPVLLKAARDAGIEHYYVEYDRATDPMGAVRESYTYLANAFREVGLQQ